MSNRPQRQCALCQRARLLCDSHLLPKAAYRLLRALNLNREAPLLMDEDNFCVSHRQISDYVLCEECEALLSDNGEDWVLKHCYRGPEDFAIAAALDARDPDYVHNGDGVFATNEMSQIIDIDAIIHFACGVFWKGAAHTWRPTRKPIHIELGRYTEPLRLFVYGGAPFPEGLILRTRISAWRGAASRLCGVMHPPESARTGGFWSHQFSMLGLSFELLAGSHIPAIYREYSTAPGARRFLTIVPEQDFREGAHLSRRYSRLQERKERRAERLQPVKPPGSD